MNKCSPFPFERDVEKNEKKLCTKVHGRMCLERITERKIEKLRKMSTHFKRESDWRKEKGRNIHLLESKGRLGKKR